MSNASAPASSAPAPHAARLLLAGFMAIVASGMGFSIRGGILEDWKGQFGFTPTELGLITGGGLVGFGIIILAGAMLADAIGYGRLMAFAFLAHVGSAVLTLAATPVYQAAGKDACYQCLYWGMFLFAIGNGTSEAVVNPLVAALYPNNKTHYLNILHAGWPAGLIAGGLVSYVMVGKVRWEVQMSLFVAPVLLYGVLCLGQRFPRSEARAAGVGFGAMLRELGMLGAAVVIGLFGVWFATLWGPTVGWIVAGVMWLAFGGVIGFTPGHWVLGLLLLVQAMVGYVELGTDSWISNITGNILANREHGLLLFVYTSALMFALRFFAGPIVHRTSPLGLLLAGALAGTVGLVLLQGAEGVVACVIALTIYGAGKTYYWPTMIAVVAERFPRGGAITIGAVGGIGMLAGGLLGSPGIGYMQDWSATRQLQENAPALYSQYRSESTNGFLFFPAIQGLDGKKVADIRKKTHLQRTPDERYVHAADLAGSRWALLVTALVPATMAVCYLLLLLYFKASGGYRQVQLE